MDPQRELCEGCLRSIDEIARWSTMTDAQKHRVWELIAERRADTATEARDGAPD